MLVIWNFPPIGRLTPAILTGDPSHVVSQYDTPESAVPYTTAILRSCLSRARAAWRIDELMVAIVDTPEPSFDSLCSALQLACKPTYVPKIVEGRDKIKAMPRGWVIQNIDRAVEATLDLADYWDYRRLLEVLIIIEAHDSLNGYIAIGLASKDYDVREAAEDFSGSRDEPGGT